MKIRSGAFIALVLSALASALTVSPSSATFSGDNGKIIYTKYNPYDYSTPYQTAGSRDGTLYVSNPDGSGEQVLKNDNSSYLRFSPNGQKIIWSSYDGSKWEASGSTVYSSNLNGSSTQALNSSQSSTSYYPQWAPLRPIRVL